EVLGQETPLAARPQDVEDGVDHVAQVGLAWPTAWVDRQVRLDQGPLRVGDVARVGLRSHVAFYAAPPLMGQSLTSRGPVLITYDRQSDRWVALKGMAFSVLSQYVDVEPGTTLGRVFDMV